MSSAGQAIGGLVGGIVGFFTPLGPLYGAQLGMMLGGLLDPPKGPTITGPRLDDLTVQTSTYGSYIPRIYGTIAVTGNIIWLMGDKITEVKKKEKVGGKGGPTQTNITFSYYATFAVAFCNGPIAGIRRIWIGGQIWYDAESDSIDAILASNEKAELFKLYLGTDTQLADPSIQADKGVANVSAYRGISYVVFDNLPLEKYGNSLAGTQVKAEIVLSSTIASPQEIWTRNANPSTAWVLAEWAGHSVSKPLTKSFDGALFTTFAYHNYGSPTAEFIRVDHTIYGDTSTIVGTETIGQNYVLPPQFSEGDFQFCSGDDNVDTVYIDGLPFYTGFGLGSSARSSVCALPKAIFILGKTNASPTCGLAIYDIDAGYIRVLSKTFSSTVGGVTYFPYFAHDDANGLFYMFIGPNVEIYNIEDGSLNSTLTAPQVIAADPYVEGGYLWSIQNASGSQVLVKYDLTTFTTISTLAMPSLGGSAATYGWKLDNLVVRYLAITARPMDIVQLDRPTNATVILGDIVQAECLQSNLLTASDIDVTELTDMVRGYRVSNLGAIRGSIEPLRAAWPFDVVQHGYDIKFKRRGSASVATITAGELDARSANDNPGISVIDSREMDIILPRQVTLKYFDYTREYDTNAQYAEHFSTDSVNEIVTELSIVLNADEAAGMAESLMDIYWMERNDIVVTLPPTYARLEPADVVTANAALVTYELRLTSVNYLADGRLECKAKYNKASVYTPAAKGEEGQSVGAALTYAGPSFYMTLDIPLMRDDDDTPGFILAMTGLNAGWPGGAVYRSDDLGETWEVLTGFTSPGATMGYCSNALAAYGSTVYDFASTLTVKMYQGALASVSEASLFAGYNWFAYGGYGRWEIIAARTVTGTYPDYVLKDLLRGQFGTEWATGTHAAFDFLVLLDTANLDFISVNASSIGVPRGYLGITNGRTLDTDSIRLNTYTGVNLECLSPINLTGNRHPTTNDWTLTATRRTRFAGWRDYVDAALGEASESYEIDVFADGTYATVKRTLTATSPAAVPYTSAQQVTDFGSNQTTLYLKWYQLSATVGRGYPLTQSITR